MTALRKTIAVVGGGVSGALTAFHLVRQGVEARVVVIDPRAEMGLGLAYSTPSLRHLLNVPANKISALPEEPEHFLDWLRENHDAEATEFTFAPRAVFGRYVRSLLAKASGVEHVQAEVVDLESVAGGADVVLDDGERIRAAAVVLATGNFDPAPMRGVSAEATSVGAYCHSAWEAATCAGLEAEAPLVLIGTGLTGVDVLLRLRELGHRGLVTAVSRHGVFPNRHQPYEAMGACAIPDGTPRTARAMLRGVRAAIAAGAPWRAVIDSLRPETNRLWTSLPAEEQMRFRRHLQRRWEVVRHRMAPPIADVIERELREGTLVIRQGALDAVNAIEGSAEVRIRTRDGEIQTMAAARVINCTGPDMNYRRVASPLMASLFGRGLVTAGLLGGGLRTDAAGAVYGGDGRVSTVLFNVGPGRLGTLLESIAIPEIREQAAELATVLRGRMKEDGRVSQRSAVTASRGLRPGLVARAAAAQ